MYDQAKKCSGAARLLLITLLGISMPASAEEFEVELDPGRFFEPCMEMTVGQALHYKFKSNDNLRFNIHYHVGDDVEYPIKANADRGSGKYTPVIDQNYCLMWKNMTSAPVSLSGNYDLVDNE